MSVEALHPSRPIGYFVHHQGRGHAERCAALLRAMPPSRPVTVFCAKPDILRGLPDHVRVVPIPSLFEPRGDEAPGLDDVAPPRSVHCAPLGWPAITEAMAQIVNWCVTERPALLVSDVSAEVAQLARLISVPHVKVLQHGDRDDPGHRSAYDGAAGLLAPFHADLAQPEWDARMRAKTHFAGGLGVETALPTRAAARATLGLDPEVEIVLVLSGGGGSGFKSAPFGIAARDRPETRWITIGHVDRDWHATEPANLIHKGWVEDAPAHIAAADVIVSSAGNTICQQVLAAGRPWIVVPEWCYFAEQARKAEALAAAGLAHVTMQPPASAQAWEAALDAARTGHDPERQRSMVDPGAAEAAAGWLDTLATALWSQAGPRVPTRLAGE